MPATTTRNRRSKWTPIEIGGIPLREYRDHVLAFTRLDAEEHEMHWQRGAIVDHLLRTERSRYGKRIVARFARDVGRQRRIVYYYLRVHEQFGVPGPCNRSDRCDVDNTDSVVQCETVNPA